MSANEEKEDKVVTDLILEKKKEIFESKMIDDINPGKRQITIVSEYIFQAAKAEKEYFNRIKKAGNIFIKNVSKGGVTTMKHHQKSGKGFKRKCWVADTTWDMSKEKIVFKSGGIIQSLSEIQSLNKIDPETGERKYKFSWEELATENIKSLAPLTIGGLGYSKAEMVDIVPLKDNARLTDKLSDKISKKHLDELISVQLVVDIHDGTEPKVKMLYFLRNGKVLM